MIPELNKWTLRISAASMLVLAVGLWKTSTLAMGYHNMIIGTAEAVELMARQFALGDIEDEIADLKSEKRDYRLERKISLKEGANDIAATYQMLIEEIDIDLMNLNKARDCIIQNADISMCKELRR